MHTLPDYMCQFVNLKVISKLTADKETVGLYFEFLSFRRCWLCQNSS